MQTILGCGHEESPHSDITRGYGIDAQGKTHCYACCADNDRLQMERDGKTMLYDCEDRITNWPDSLSFRITNRRKSRHNIARWRYDLWFVDHTGAWWHGVRYGDNTQIVHCKRAKGR